MAAGGGGLRQRGPKACRPDPARGRPERRSSARRVCVCVCPSTEGEVRDDHWAGEEGGTCGRLVTDNRRRAQKSGVKAPSTAPLPAA